MSLLGDQIKLNKYDEYHYIEAHNDIQDIVSNWYVGEQDNYKSNVKDLFINIEIFDGDTNTRAIKIRKSIYSIEQINKIVNKYEEFLKELNNV